VIGYSYGLNIDVIEYVLLLRLDVKLVCFIVLYGVLNSDVMQMLIMMLM
jgi:hypothetical protein